MLTALRDALTFARPPFALQAGTFASDIPLRSRRLQVLSYALAQISSAATLLDDHLRGTLNIAHRLLVAWQSIVVAATAREKRHKSPAGRNAPAGTTSGDESSGGGSPGPLRQDSPGGDLVTSLDSCSFLEDQVARHVEFARRAVVAALFEQFLQVTVDKSVDDLVLFDWPGPEFASPVWGPSSHSKSRHHHSTAGGEGLEEDNNQFTSQSDGEEDKVRHDRRKERVCLGCKRTRCGADLPFWPMVQFHLNTESDDKNEEIPLSIQVFTRAAVAFNPTVCALKLMSRCVLHARNVRNVDHEVAAGADSTMGVEGFFYVVVAGRTVGMCEHSEPCFGSCKFLFVRCEESEWQMQSGVVDAKEWTGSPASASSTQFSSLSRPERDKTHVAPGLYSMMDNMMRSLTQTRVVLPFNWSNTRPYFQGTTDRVSSVLLKRFTQSFSNDDSKRGSTFIDLPPIGRGGKSGTVKAGVKPEDRGASRTVPKRSRARECRTALCHHHDDSDDDETEESTQSWLVMHSNRCTATGNFFAGSTSRKGRLIADVADSTGTTLSRSAFDEPDLAMSLGQAILVPPNAGHETKYREQIPTEHLQGATESVSSGQVAFADELLARLNFWRTRGEPRRCYYYEPAVDDGSQTKMKDSTADFGANTGGGFAASSDPPKDMSVKMPLKLLFTRVGMIQFYPLGDSVYCNSRGQQLLNLALAESTELVICTARESRPHRGWHDHCRRDTPKNDGYDASDGCTLSDDDGDPFSWGRSDDVAMKATVQWAQGEVTTDDDGDDGPEACDGDFLSETDGDSRLPKTPHVVRHRSLSTMEQRRRKNERLKIEFRLAFSQRLDALLVDGQKAKPIAALTLCQAPQDACHLRSDTQIVQQTAFVVASFSYCVSRLLRHLREEKLLMVDMDRTLLDNAIFADDDLLSSDDRTAVPWSHNRGAREKSHALRYETRKEVHYPVGEAPHHAMRTETIYVRHGVRRLLRRFAVEWGIPVVLVTKSSRPRTEAILSQVLDPDGELFPAGRGRVVTAELIRRFASSDTTFPTSSLSSSSCDDDWQRQQEELARALKSTRAVLQEFECASGQRRGPHSFSPKARSVAVLDDSPQIWVEADWPCTVPVAPYTLGRVDPRGYFTASGLVASMLLSALYRSRCVVCSIPHCAAHVRESRADAAAGGGRRKADSRVSADGDESGAREKNILEVTCVEDLRSALSSVHFTGTFGPDAARDAMAYAGESVVEEVGSVHEGGSWDNGDVEDVTPL